MTKNSALFTRFLLGLLLLATVFYYGRIHWRIIWLSEPLTLREPAFVIDARGYLDPHAARPYTLESIPQYTNLYGMGYLWGAAPFGIFLPFSEYANLRLANAFYLGILLLVFWMGSTAGAPLQRLFGLVLVYALFVSSPSVAASPDILGCLLYTLAWAVAARGRFKPGALLLSILFAFLAFLTKPYFLLAAGAIGSYLFLFRSKKTGLIYAFCAIALFVTGLRLVHFRYPYYFFETFKVHAVETTYSFNWGLQQWLEFIILVPAPCCACVWTIAQQFRKGYRTARLQWPLKESFFSKSLPISPYDWGALVTVAALGCLLSWHGGAYLIYFWHLLLPLLVLGFMDRPAMNPIWPCLNVAGLLLLSPPLPPAGVSKDWVALGELVAKHPNGYIDPYFEPLLPPGNSRAVENAQSEYALMNGSLYGSPPLSTHCNEYLAGFTDNIRRRKFDSFIVAPGAFLSNVFLNLIMEHYEISGVYKIRPYYLSFRDRLLFGHKTAYALFLTPRKNETARPSK